MLGHHDKRCGKYYGKDCQCITCAWDNYQYKSYIRCCVRHGRFCSARKGPCPDYIRESEDQPVEGPKTEQMTIGGDDNGKLRRVRKRAAKK